MVCRKCSFDDSMCSSLHPAMRKHTAARQVFDKIPPDSVDVVTRHWQKKVCLAICTTLIRGCTRSAWQLPFVHPFQAGDAPLPVDVRNDIKEYHCLQSYLVRVLKSWFTHCSCILCVEQSSCAGFWASACFIGLLITGNKLKSKEAGFNWMWKVVLYK